MSQEPLRPMSDFVTPAENPRKSWPLVEQLIAAVETERNRSETCDLLTEAAKEIESLRNEVVHLQIQNAQEGRVIWAVLGKVLFGHTQAVPSDEEIAQTVTGMPQEWAMVQEAVKRLEQQPFSLDDYQRGCAKTANYPEAGSGSTTAVTYTVLGIAGEGGEVADRWKKVLRGDHGESVLTPEVKELLAKEIGDQLWYAARLSAELGMDLSEVAQGNLDKLASRMERGVIKGSGDLR